MNHYRHHCHGLNLVSNVPLPVVCPGWSSEGSAPVKIQLFSGAARIPSEAPFYQSEFHAQNGEPTMRAWRKGNQYQIHYADGAFFRICTSEIKGTWFHPGNLDNAVGYLVGPILALVLRQRGFACLHASGICNSSGAIAFAGAAEVGKSTLAAAMLQRGWRLLSDDLVPIVRRAEWQTCGAYPALRLWPESAAALYAGENFDPSSPTWPKYLVKEQKRFSAGNMALRAIFILKRESSRPPEVRRLRGSNALMVLIQNSYLNYLPDHELQARGLGLLGRAAEEVPVYSLLLPDDLDLLPTAVRCVEETLGRMSSPHLFPRIK